MVRSPQAGVFKAAARITNAVKNRVSNSPYAAWKMFIDEPMLRKILNCTITEGQTRKASWSITIEMLEAYLALEYARGIYGKEHSTVFLWRKIYCPTVFKDTMFRFTYKKIRKIRLFDIKSTRSSRIQNDRFIHIRDIFDRFARNCRKVNTPSFSLTTDEQLLPIESLSFHYVYAIQPR